MRSSSCKIKIMTDEQLLSKRLLENIEITCSNDNVS